MLFAAPGPVMLSAVLHNLPAEGAEVLLARPAHDVVVVLNLVIFFFFFKQRVI